MEIQCEKENYDEIFNEFKINLKIGNIDKVKEMLNKYSNINLPNKIDP